jgi:phage FluMu protein Com
MLELPLSEEPTYMPATVLAEYRCTCGKLLFKGALLHARVEIKCKRCRVIVAVTVPLAV